MFGVLIFAVILGLIPAVIAQTKGRSFMGWWLYGLALFLVALPHSLLASDLRRPCPKCASRIPREAHLCPFCRSDLDALGYAPIQGRRTLTVPLTGEHYLALVIGGCLAVAGCVMIFLVGRHFWPEPAKAARIAMRCATTDLVLSDTKTERRGDTLYVSGRIANNCQQGTGAYIVWLGTRKSDGQELFHHRIYVNNGEPIGAERQVAFAESFAAPLWPTDTALTAYPADPAL